MLDAEGKMSSAANIALSSGGFTCESVHLSTEPASVSCYSVSADSTLAIAKLVLAHDIIDMPLDRTTSVFTLFVGESVYTRPLLIRAPYRRSTLLHTRHS